MRFLIDPGSLHLAFGEVSAPKQLSSGMHCEIKTCPRCQNDKWKCSVNLENGWVFCQVCQEKGVHINQLIPAVEIELLRDRMALIDSPKHTPTPLPPIPELCERVDLLPEDHPAVQYLQSRRVHPALAAMKGTVWKPWGIQCWEKNGKPVFETLQGLIHQIFRRGELVAWQFEAVPRIAGSSLPKYVTAPGSKLGSSFFNFDAAESDPRCVIVECVYDAYRFPYNGVAVCKNTLSKGQVKLLSTCNFEEIILVLDSDQTDKHMADELAKLKTIAPARAVRLENGDPADHHEDALARLLGLRSYDTITTHETLRLAKLSLQELAAERAAAWHSK